MVSVRLHAVPPLCDFMFENIDNGASVAGFWLLGGSAELQIAGFFSVEAGGAWLMSSIWGTEPDRFVRAGVAPILSDRRDSTGVGSVTQLGLTAGYRAFTRFASPDGHDGSEVTRGATGGVSLDFSRFSSPRVAFTYRFAATYTMPLSQTRTGYWGGAYFEEFADLRNALDFSFQIGLAF